MAKRGLGRGLSVLIPANEADDAPGLLMVPLDRIVPNPHQPRREFASEALTELVASIREHGIIQPLVVRRNEGAGWQIIAGERRWRAAKLAGLTEVPVVVKDVAPQQMLELALVENVQRADLNPLEEAFAYQQLSAEFGLSQAEIARRVGKSRVAITNTLRLLQASPAVQQALLDREITEGHARALLGLPQPAQDRALRIVRERQLTVRQTESLVKQWREQTAAAPAAKPPEIQALERHFQAALGTRVQLQAGKKGGKVVIYYYSDEEFRALYQRLTGEDL